MPHANHQFMNWPQLGEATDLRMFFVMTYSVDWSVPLGSYNFSYFFYHGGYEVTRMYLNTNWIPRQVKYFMFLCEIYIIPILITPFFAVLSL